MDATIEIFGASVIVIGDFNPAIISPDWLEQNNLIGNEDADEARQSESTVISHKATQFETNWFAMQVLERQFSLTSKGVLSPSIKDLVAGIFSTLSHTPISAIGINFMAHYKMLRADDYYKIGDVLAPKTIWRELFKDENESVGLEALVIRVEPCKRGDAPTTGNLKRITLQISDKVHQGIFVSLNDHNNITKSKDSSSTEAADKIVALLDQKWQNTLDESKNIFNSVIERALQQ